MAQHADDSFREIQLNGKQLVFLFMAATIVSVVIFLCGVLVGRGVRSATTAQEALGIESPVAAASPAALPQRVPDPVLPEADPRTAAAPNEVDDLTYFSRLEEGKPPVEDLKPAQDAKPAAAALAVPAQPKPAARETAPAATRTAAPAPAPVAASAKAATPATATPKASAPAPAGGDWAVQVAALNVRGEAEAVAKRLSAKGYSAYVASAGSVYRVRIGPFRSRPEADAMALKLEKEEKFKPWVTR